MTAIATMRVARPTNSIQALLPFYVDGVGLQILDSFEGHQGFDGVMLGRPGWPYQLEFTQQRGHVVAGSPTQDHLLVFFFAQRHAWNEAIDRMRRAGFGPVPSCNPYWDIAGKTFEDADGYRVVLQGEAWPGA